MAVPNTATPEAALGALDAEARPANAGVGLVGRPTPALDVSKQTRANWRKLGALDDKKLDQAEPLSAFFDVSVFPTRSLPSFTIPRY